MAPYGISACDYQFYIMMDFISDGSPSKIRQVTDVERPTRVTSDDISDSNIEVGLQAIGEFLASAYWTGFRQDW